MYNYEEEKPKIFTENGIRRLLQIRDMAFRLIDQTGAATCGKIMETITGDSWQNLACIHFLVELGDLHEVTSGVEGMATQYRIYTRG